METIATAETTDFTRASSPDFFARIPRDFARMHLILSVGRDNDHDAERLVVSSRSDRFAVYNVGVRLGRRAVVEVANDDEELARAIDRAYERASNPTAANADSLSMRSPKFGGDAREDFSVDSLLASVDRDLLSMSGKGPVIRLVDAILFEALGVGASDVHVQPLADRTIVRYRADGALLDVHELPRKLTGEVISRIKVMGRMDIAERRVPQDGRATVTIGERGIDLRISTLPTSYGERAVVRLLDNSQQLCDFERLGMPADVTTAFLAQASKANGIVLVTGPTGSGKTTTLYSTLRRLSSPERNLMTIEDPIEYELSTVGLAISQSQVNHKKGVTFATGLRHILRQDPDVIMVGEIRDAATARIAIQSSLTGHLVFSTLHTNDAPSAVTRLIDLGVEPYLVSASLSAVLAQRLVRLVHSDCRGAGCDACLGAGLKGRTGLFELMLLDEAIRELITAGATLSMMREAARRTGMRTLREEGEMLVQAGRTTLVEIERVTHMV